MIPNNIVYATAFRGTIIVVTAEGSLYILDRNSNVWMWFGTIPAHLIQ